MAKKYVVQGAPIHCQHGWADAARKLYTSYGTNVKAGKKLLTTEVDNTIQCLGGGFGICTSSMVNMELTSLMHANLSNKQQMTKICALEDEEGEYVMEKCNFKAAFFWQNANERVEIYGGRALLEDSWLFCTHGMGFITIDHHGQSGDNPAWQIQENLKELEKAVDQYMKEQGIDEKHRNALIESILLWNGYYELPWKYESTEETRAFCSFLESTNPYLFNYFERGLYLPEGADSIDVTYMLGIYKAREQGNPMFGMINSENANDSGMLNGYLETFRVEPGKDMLEVLSYYLSYYQSPDYDSTSRYTYFMSLPDDPMRDYFCEQPIDVIGESGFYSFNEGTPVNPYGTAGDQYFEYFNQELSESEMAALNSDTLSFFISREGNASDETVKSFMENVKAHAK